MTRQTTDKYLYLLCRVPWSPDHFPCVSVCHVLAPNAPCWQARRGSIGRPGSPSTVTNHGRGATVAAQGQRRWPQHRAHRGRIGDDWWHQGCRARSHRAPSILSAAPGPRQGLRRRLSQPVSRGHRRPNQAHAHALAGLSAWSKFPKLHRPRTAPEGPPALPPVQAARPLRARCFWAR